MQESDTTVFTWPKSAKTQPSDTNKSLRLLFPQPSQRIVSEKVSEKVRKKACHDRQLRRAGAQPQLGTRSGHSVAARYRFLQAADAPVHLEALPANPRLVLAVEPHPFCTRGRHVSAGGASPPDGARSPTPLSQVGTGLARRQHVLWPQRNF